jgi:hypothetical protein
LDQQNTLTAEKLASVRLRNHDFASEKHHSSRQVVIWGAKNNIGARTHESAPAEFTKPRKPIWNAKKYK